MNTAATDQPATARGPTRGRSLLAGRVRFALVLATAATALIAVAAHYGTLRAAGAETARQRLLGSARLGAAQMADLDLTDLVRRGPSDTQSVRLNDRRALQIFKSWSLGVMRETNAVATALLDAHGKVLWSWPPSAEIAERLRPPAGETSGFVYELPTVDSCAPGPPLTVAVAPINRGPEVLPVAYAGVLAAVTSIPVWFSGYFAVFVAIIAVLTAVVIAVALSHLQGRVFDPLARLSSQLVSSPPGRMPRFPVERSDELGIIARHLHELCAKLEAAHQHADRLEKSIDTVVTRETKHISRLLRRAERDAEIDPLTRLANRRFIEERLKGLFDEQMARGTNLVIIMFDVDNFKPLNDTAGHVAGDAILRFVGELLRGALRDSDVGIRYGGDEFALVLVDVTGHQARAIAERILRLFAQRMSIMNVKTPVTLSAGIASLHDVKAASGTELLAKADEALYQSKQSGKNTVVQAEASG